MFLCFMFILWPIRGWSMFLYNRIWNKLNITWYCVESECGIFHVWRFFWAISSVLLLPPTAPKAREILKCPCPSITLSFCTATLKCIAVFSWKTLQVCAPCHGGVLYSFWYWWDVVWILHDIFPQFFSHFFAFYAISNIFRNTNLNFFFRKQNNSPQKSSHYNNLPE